MSREVHVRVCESLGVKVPRATRLTTFKAVDLCQKSSAILDINAPTSGMLSFDSPYPISAHNLELHFRLIFILPNTIPIMHGGKSPTRCPGGRT
jgi:hypothetical protein